MNEKLLVIPELYVKRLIEYLASRPYAEVHQAMNQMQTLKSLDKHLEEQKKDSKVKASEK